jgi:hypothetical protein
MDRAASASRHKVFHKLFDLPFTEELVADYSCALSKTILLHGRMYVSHSYLCFMSNIFKKTVEKIPLHDITHVEKATIALIIPNSIRVHCKNPTRKLFFASFMTRDAAFERISKLVSAGRTRHYKQHLSLSVNDAAEVKRRERLNSNPSAASRSPSRGRDSVGGHITQSTPLSTSSSSSSSSAKLYRRTRMGSEVSRGPASVSGRRERSNSKVVYSPQKSNDRRNSVVARSESMDFGDHVPQISKQLRGLDSTESTGLTLLCQEHFAGLSLFQFWCLFMADNSPCSLGDFHAERKNRDVLVTKWKRWKNHTGGGTLGAADLSFMDCDIVREFSCVMPLSGPIGPDATRLHKVQKLRRVASGAREGPLVVESCTVTPDVPFGDSFQVNVKWEISPLPPSSGSDQSAGIQCRVYAQIEYTKQSWSLGLLSGTINSRGIADTKLFFEAWCQRALAFAASEPEELAAVQALEEQWMTPVEQESAQEDTDADQGDEQKQAQTHKQTRGGGSRASGDPSASASSSSASMDCSTQESQGERPPPHRSPGSSSSGKGSQSQRAMLVAAVVCVLAWLLGGSVTYTVSKSTVLTVVLVGGYAAWNISVHMKRLRQRISALEKMQQQ